MYGKPPYTASNIVELLNNIQKKPLYFPKQPQINPVVEDAIRKMLVVDPKKRIGWEDLFNHKITTFLEDEIKEDLEATRN